VKAKPQDQQINIVELFDQLISLFDEERLIRFERKAQKRGFDYLAAMLKAKRKELEAQQE
jgi:hypothetical protein